MNNPTTTTQLVWHTDPNDKPDFINHTVITAYCFKRGKGYDTIAERLYFSLDDVHFGLHEYQQSLAWAYIDDTIPQQLLNEIKEYNTQNEVLLKQKRIAELEAEIAALKAECDSPKKGLTVIVP